MILHALHCELSLCSVRPILNGFCSAFGIRVVLPGFDSFCINHDPCCRSRLQEGNDCHICSLQTALLFACSIAQVQAPFWHTITRPAASLDAAGNDARMLCPQHDWSYCTQTVCVSCSCSCCLQALGLQNQYWQENLTFRVRGNQRALA